MMPSTKVEWLAVHDACDSAEAIQGDAYSIAIERIRRPRQALAWTAHVMEKSWLVTTNWADLLHRLAGPDANP